MLYSFKHKVNLPFQDIPADAYQKLRNITDSFQ